MAIIDIQNVSKTFEAGDSSGELRVLRDISLSIEENEFICILGPSGCGKSTLLRIISGLEKATGGNVTYRGERVAAPRKEIGVVFQNYSLMPWLNVEDNIALGLRFKHASESEIQKTVSDYLQMIGMVLAASSNFLSFTSLMKVGISIFTGHPSTHLAFLQFRQRSASATASSSLYP